MESDDIRPIMYGDYRQSVTRSAIQPRRKIHATPHATPHATTGDETLPDSSVPPQSVAWSLRFLVGNFRTALPLAVSDQVGLACALSLAGWILPVSPSLSKLVSGIHVHLACGLGFVFFAARLYPGVGLTARVEVRRCITYASYVFLLLILAVLTFDIPRPIAKWLVVAWAVSLVSVPGGRLVTRRVFGRFRWWRQPVLTIADSRSRAIGSLNRQLLANPHLGLTPIDTCIDTSIDVVRGTYHGMDDEDVVIRFDAKKSIAKAVRQYHVYRAIVTMPDESDTRSVHWFVACAEWFPCLSVVSPVLRQGLPLVGRSSWTLGGFNGIEVHNRLRSPTTFLVKRACEASIAAIGIVLSLPIVLVIAAAIRFSSPGPVLYGQQRIGRGGRRFRLWKFRTMTGNADEILGDYLDSCPELKEQWEREKKLSHDPRIVPYVGQFLRKSSLDELPQLWNVLMGDMCLIGPRPLPEYHLDEFDLRFRCYRQNVAPGITGLWQVSNRGNGYPETYITCDSRYIRNWSFWLDTRVFLRTFKAVISGRGAV